MPLFQIQDSIEKKYRLVDHWRPCVEKTWSLGKYVSSLRVVPLCCRPHCHYRQDVRTSFTSNKGFSDWHPEVLRLHIEHSTRAIKDRENMARILTTPKEQEAVHDKNISVYLSLVLNWHDIQATYLAAPHPDLPRFLSESKQNHCFILGGESIVV